MKKLSFIFNILKRRVLNIILLSVMFSALLLIFMVGFSLKDIFYDYLRSGYGNIPDMQVKVDNLSKKQLLEITKKTKETNEYIDILFGYENIYNITVTDSEDSVLAKEMPVLIKGLNLQNKLLVEIDAKEKLLDIKNFEYDDALRIELDIDDLDILDKDSVRFIARGETIDFNFCTVTSLEENTFVVESRFCKDDVDYFFQKLQEKDSQFLMVTIDNKDVKLRIIETDMLYRTLVLEYKNKIDISEVSIKLEDINLNDNFIESIEVYDSELIIAFKRDENVELEYKRFISYILKNYINYNRFVLNVKYYVFNNDEEELLESYEKELTKLNELTDFLDIITHTKGNLAVASSYLAKNLNNLGVLDNFTIATQDQEFTASIRSTFFYNPEKMYDKNILIFNKLVLDEQFGVGDKNNFIDIYVDTTNLSQLEDIKKIILEFDKDAKFIMQDEIIPSIAPKRALFNMIVIFLSIFIFSILFISMYVVLRQFYSNFESELALLKLFGVNHPYQMYINSISFLISSLLIYFVLKYEESIINEIMMKYFFTKYEFDMSNYIISLAILFVYILVIYMLEILSIKKLNIIKGQ